MITATNHPLPFENLSPKDFERLCLWIAKREGYEQVELIGPSGNDRGLDLLAVKDGLRIGFQCKRHREFGPAAAKAAIEEVLQRRPPEERPDTLILVVSANVGDAARRRAEETALGMSCELWAGDELDELVKRHPDVLREFFQVGTYPATPSSGPTSAIHSGVMMPPKRPPHYLKRSVYLEQIGTALLGVEEGPVGISSQGRVGVQGMGGIGKTVLASAVLAEPAIGLAFPDGVHWISVGQSPDLLRLLQELSFSVAAKETPFRSVHLGKLALSRLLVDRRMLLVLDDVWELDHANALDVVGPKGRLLITTRNRKVLSGLGAEEIRLDLLSEEQALELLARWAHRHVTNLPSQALDIVRECGRLPLALAMIGSMVELASTAWDIALERLRRADLDRLRRAFPDYPYPDLLKALAVSVDALSEVDRDRYSELAVFPRDSAIPQEAILTLWEGSGLDHLEGRELLARLEALSLLQTTNQDRIALHDLQVDFLRHQIENLLALHRRLVRAYERKCSDGFATGPDDGYFFQRLPWHLSRADLGDHLQELLFDFPWLDAKLKATDISSLLADYGYISKIEAARAEASSVQSALRLAAHVLAQEPGQLAGQLLGRLSPNLGSQVERLLTSCAPIPPKAWLRPLKPTLRTPGGPLLRTLEGHSDWVLAVTSLGDGRVVSGASDQTLRVWDIESGDTLHILEGHSTRIKSLTAMGGGRVVSAAYDHTIEIWDIEAGKLLRTLESPTPTFEGIQDLAAIDASRLVTASEDGFLRLWDFGTGNIVQTLEGHTGGVLTVLALGDGRIVSGSRDQTLRVWDIDSGKSVHTLTGHTDIVRSVAHFGDGRIISASKDETLRIWDVDRGKQIRVIENKPTGGKSVIALADNRVVTVHGLGIVVWDLDDYEQRKLLHGHSSHVFAVASLGDHRVVSASADGTLRIWDIDLPEKSLLGGMEEYEEEIQMIEGHPHKRILSATYDSVELTWLEQDSGNSEVTPEPRTLGLASVGHPFSAAVSFDADLEVWEWAHRTSLPDFERAEERSSLLRAMTPLGDGRVAVVPFVENLQIWDIGSGEKLAGFEVPKLRILDLATLGNGRIVTACNDHTLRIWDVETTRQLQILEGHTDEVVAVNTLPGGRIVSASADATIRVWDADTGQCLRTLEGHTDKVTGVAAFDDQLIASASADSTLRVWNLATGACEASFFLDAPVSGLATLSDHRTLLTGHQLEGLHLLKLEGI